MAAIVVIGGGATGFLVALFSLFLGTGLWAALGLWCAVGFATSLLAGVFALIPRRNTLVTEY
ncbi:hypothetical protein [Pseudogemmobacter sonorensis]|uniref:hypothetical protein n=1 Tax=Pseudogemmobacter sonorensis TaxID=2989681 RepID=UPI0036AAB272